MLPGRPGELRHRARRWPSWSINNPLDFLGGIFGDDTLAFAGIGAGLVTALWVVGMINSINFIDGLDGLSTGVAFIAAVTLGVVSLGYHRRTSPWWPCCAPSWPGRCWAILPWNFYPAKVFIGTTGVMVVGYLLAVLAILGTAKIAVALLILGVPIIDTFWIITRRLLSGHSPFTPDRGHIHHRLLDLGLTHRGAVLLDLRHHRRPGRATASCWRWLGTHLCLHGHRRRLGPAPAAADLPRRARRGARGEHVLMMRRAAEARMDGDSGARPTLSTGRHDHAGDPS